MDNLKVLQRVILEIKFKVEQNTPVSNTDRENYITIIESLDKQIPKDVINKQTNYLKYCPVCGAALLRENDIYCSDCGQKLIWD